MERYWLRKTGSGWRKVSRDQFIKAERAAGFWPRGMGSLVATGGFSQTTAGGTIQGRITNGRVTKKDYGYDPEFLKVVKRSSANATR